MGATIPLRQDSPGGRAVADKNVSIDRLREFSVLVVVCMHTLFFFPNALLFLGKTLGNGYYGVTAFFCTSGFLITTNLLKRYGEVAKVDLYAFYVMRFARIVPPLVLLCAALAWLSTTPVEAFHFTAPLSLKDTLLSVLKLRYNHYYRHGGYLMVVWSILWSLSIEEVFYLAYPLAAKLTRRTAVLAVGLVAVVADAIYHRRGDLYTIYDYFGCFDGIALGALAALTSKRFGHFVGRPAAWMIMLVGIFVAGGTYVLMDVNAHYNLGLTLVASGTALILFASQRAPFADTRSSPYDPLAYLGRLSYELYLFHMTIYALLASVIVPKYPFLVFAIAILCAVTVSNAIARFYAEPLNRRLRKALLPVRPLRIAEVTPIPSTVA